MDETVVVWPSRRGDDLALIEALASGASRRDAAARAGVGERTVRRRLQDPVFQARVEEARGQRLQGVYEALRAHGQEAAATLRELMGSANPPAVRLRAATVVVDRLLRYQEAVGLQDQLDRVEVGLGLDPLEADAS